MAKSRTIFLTGASSGYGRALALEYASRGAHLALAARRESELTSLAREVEALGARVHVHVLDVCNPSAVKDAVLRAERELGSLDMVIANAGVGWGSHASTAQWADIEHLLQVNVVGAMATLTAAVPVMLAQQRGHLVGITSLAGRRGLPKSGPYSASKAALSTFLESLRIDLAQAGISVTDVQPGFMSTPMAEGAKHPRPFQWTSEKSAKYTADKLEGARAPAVIAFPWQLDFATCLSRILPVWIYDRVMR